MGTERVASGQKMFSLPFSPNLQLTTTDCFCQYCGCYLPVGSSVRSVSGRRFCPAHTDTTAFSVATATQAFGNFAFEFDDTGFHYLFDPDVLLNSSESSGVVSRSPLVTLCENRAFCVEIFHGSAPTPSSVPDKASEFGPVPTSNVLGEWFGMSKVRERDTTSAEILGSLREVSAAEAPKAATHRYHNQIQVSVCFPVLNTLTSYIERQTNPSNPEALAPSYLAPLSLQETVADMPFPKSREKDSLPVVYAFPDTSCCQLTMRWPIYLATPPQGVALAGYPYLSVHVYCSYFPAKMPLLISPSTKHYCLRADLAMHLLEDYPRTHYITEEFSAMISRYLGHTAIRVVSPYRYLVLAGYFDILDQTMSVTERIRAHMTSLADRRKRPGNLERDGVSSFQDLLGASPTGAEVVVYMVGGLNTESYNSRRDKTTTCYTRNYVCMNNYIALYNFERLRLNRMLMSDASCCGQAAPAPAPASPAAGAGTGVGTALARQDAASLPEECIRYLTMSLTLPRNPVLSKVFFESYQNSPANLAPFQLPSWSWAGHYYNLCVSLLDGAGAVIPRVVDDCDEYLCGGEKPEALHAITARRAEAGYSARSPCYVHLTSVCDLTTMYGITISRATLGPVADQPDDGADRAASLPSTGGDGEAGVGVSAASTAASASALPADNEDEDRATYNEEGRLLSGLIGHCPFKPVYPATWLAFRISLPKYDFASPDDNYLLSASLSKQSSVSGSVPGTQTTVDSVAMPLRDTDLGALHIASVSVPEQVPLCAGPGPDGDASGCGGSGCITGSDGPADEPFILPILNSVLAVNQTLDGVPPMEVQVRAENVIVDGLDRIYPQDYTNAFYNRSVSIVSSELRALPPQVFTDRGSNFSANDFIIHTVASDFGSFVDPGAVRKIVEANARTTANRMLLYRAYSHLRNEESRSDGET